MTTKTLTDPVAEAEAALVTARDAEQEAVDALQRLDAQIISGDTTVTVQDRADAEHAVTHARLITQGAAQALQNAMDTARRERLAKLSAEAVELAGDPDAAIEAMQVIEEAVYGLLVADSARYQNLTRWISTARREGVPQFEPGAKLRPDSKGRMPYTELSDEHGNVGWQEAGMGRAETFYAAGRKFSRSNNPGELIRAAVDRACQRAGGRTGDYLQLNHRPDSRLVADPEGWIRDRY